jgi:hypothetical protein
MLRTGRRGKHPSLAELKDQSKLIEQRVETLMSYLNSLRLHFYGSFQAAASTVNNDPTHFNNATFKPEYQQREEGNNANGWWNPRGDANWRMIGCNITSAWLRNGGPATSADPVLTYLIADSDRTVTAKLVDLDPAQQGVSEIWGMEIRIASQQGRTLLRAKYQVAGFMDLFERVFNGGQGDSKACAKYQSVLTNFEWGDIADSPFLLELQKAASNGLLSIKFNVDAFDDDFISPAFTIGRVAGTIGPAGDGEPCHFVVGRHLMTTAAPSQAFFIPAGNLNFCEAVVDQAVGKIYLDLGNSLCTSSVGGPFQNFGAMTLVCEATDASGNAQTLPLGSVDYLADNWYETTAGVAVLPSNRKLSADELSAIASNPLAILLALSGQQPAPAIAEPPGGLYVRADQFVFRLNPGESALIHLYATQFGAPLAAARVINFLDSTQIGGLGPPVGVPETALDFPRSVVLDEFGQAYFQVAASDPGNPRGYIDGQVYGIRSAIEDTLAPGVAYPFDPSELVSLLVWNEFTPDRPVTWYRSLQPIFQQYANLYPIMSRFVDLSDYKSVTANTYSLSAAFGLDPEDPNYMPVTRDLSRQKRKAILEWLKNPLQGTMPISAPPPAAALQESPETPAALPVRGGKAAFFAQIGSRRKRR